MSQLLQIHWQFEDGHTEFIAQKCVEDEKDLHSWEDSVVEEHPLPEGATWMQCNEQSEYFVRQVLRNDKTHNPVKGLKLTVRPIYG